MRKIIVSMRVTLDGFFAGPHGELDWMEEFSDEALASYEAELQDGVDTTLFGRETYQGFASYWPAVARDSSAPAGMVVYAERLNAMRKLVFSTTLRESEWENTTIVKEIVPEEIVALKQENGRDIVIYGSGSVVQTLTNLGLVDRYHLLVYPLLLGSGKRLFEDISHRVRLKLIGTQTHPSGVAVLTYEPELIVTPREHEV